MEKLTRHGVRDLNHLGSKRFKAEKLRAEADELEQEASRKAKISIWARRRADEIDNEVSALRKQAASLQMEAETLCPR